MPIDWNDREKSKQFRLALERVYVDYDELDRFVDEELSENLAKISEKTRMDTVTFRLLKWARSESKLDELFEAFCRENPNDPDIPKLKQKTLVKQPLNLLEADWDSLFDCFFPHEDFADAQRSFFDGFKQVFGKHLREVRPDQPAFGGLSDIQDLLMVFDSPELAVCFAECAIAQIQRSSDATNTKRDLTELKQWRDRIADRFNVASDIPTPDQSRVCHAYLLVALDVLAGSEVIVYPELHIAGQETPIKFGADKARCSIDRATEPIAQWIRLAEDVLDASNYQVDEVVLEVFLPCKYLEEDIATTWKVKDKRNDEIDFGNHRRFLVRSLDRVRDRQVRKLLKQRWAVLEACVKAKTACSAFHLQTCCPSRKGDLSAILKDKSAPGLKLVASLPTDLDKRTTLLYDIIDAAVPIALWVSGVTDINADDLKIEFDELLNCDNCDLSNFADLARQWRRRRLSSPLATPIRLLCDHPDRFPTNLPDPTQDDDLLVAS